MFIKVINYELIEKNSKELFFLLGSLIFYKHFRYADDISCIRIHKILLFSLFPNHLHYLVISMLFTIAN